MSGRTAALAGPSVVPVDISALDEVERSYFATVVTLLCSPAMAPTRQRLRSGEIALAIEGNEVTWVDADQVANEIAAHLRAAHP